MAFNYAEYNHFLANIRNISKDKAIRILHEDYLTSKDFAGALFNPGDAQNISEYVSEMYRLTSKTKAVKLFIDTISEYGPDVYDRWVATYVFSVASFNLDAANKAVSDIQTDADNGKISKSKAKDEMEEMDDYINLLGRLNKISGKIIKVDAKVLSRKSGVDKEFCKYAFKTTPNPCYINRFRIGYYLNQLLNELYTEIDATENELSEIDWKVFFKTLFGKENVLECATFILLEGAHRTKGFKHQNVRKIWDSLTAFALDELEGADAPARNQMIELYIKRIEKMFANGSFDLRVDLNSLPETEFPQLTQTVAKYADQLSRAFKTKTTENA